MADTVNPMLGSQLVSKSMLTSATDSITNQVRTSETSSLADSSLSTSSLSPTSSASSSTSDHGQNLVSNINNSNLTPLSSNNGEQVKSLLCQTQEAQVQHVDHLSPETSPASAASIANNTVTSINAKDFQLLSKEAQELKIKLRKLQLEVDEKNEIINVLKDELETTKEQSDKLQRNNIQLLKDSKRVKFLQDENDFLQDKVSNVEKLELEIKRLREKLAELDFLKLRITELEEDRSRAQEDSSLFEDKWKQSEIKIARISELEIELNKWKSFSHEIEEEKNSIQSKLLESIEQEAKLNSVNKQVEDEVVRLRSLIKSYEEQRDEEQASNSLIMSVNDLKQMDLYSKQNGDNIEATADTSIKYELDKQIEKELAEENRDLKEKLHQQAERFNELSEKNKAFSEELVDNKKTIYELRQDLACEKNLTHKLSNQLTSMTKQIKNLDKQFLSTHEVVPKKISITSNELNGPSNVNQDTDSINLKSVKNTCAILSQNTASSDVQKSEDFNQNLPNVGERRTPSRSPVNGQAVAATAATTTTTAVTISTKTVGAVGRIETAPAIETNERIAISQPNRSTPLDGGDLVITASSVSATPTRSISDKVPSVASTGKADPILEPTADKGSLQKLISTTGTVGANSNKRAKPIPATQLGAAVSRDNLPDCYEVSGDIDKPTSNGSTLRDVNRVEGEGEEKGESMVQIRAPTPVKARSNSSNFVRNSLPSRSVNFGHSKSSAYLDRIRASVTATTTTNTTSSFNEQTRNVVLAQKQTHRPGPDTAHRLLNCMLEHLHSERCYVDRTVGLVQTSQVVASDPRQQVSTDLKSSRQLNALIDPVSNERLMLSLLHQGHAGLLPASHHPHHQTHNMSIDKPELTEQQIAHLASLHHQHYYHHLQHMHQLHQLHHQHHYHMHQHRMYHKYNHKPTEPSTGSNGLAQQQSNGEPTMQENQHHLAAHHPASPTRQREAIYTGGSQFHAASVKTYANMTINNQAKPFLEHQRLVNDQNHPRLHLHHHHQQRHNHTQQSELSDTRFSSRQNARTSPIRNCSSSNNGNTLQQIDEMNGLPSLESSGLNHRVKHYSEHGTQEVVSPEAISPADQSPTSSSSSPTSTSSTSSHLNQSSGSSSSSMNSLSAPSGLTGRPDARNGFVDLNGRHYSIERDLINAVPMTATLSRVGSCRASMPANQLVAKVGCQHQDVSQMRTPVKSQQPPMRNSKILNLSQQAGNQHTTNNLLNGRARAYTEKDGIDRLKANNLASISLNDNLAFASLRAPKKKSGESINHSLTVNNNISNRNNTCNNNSGGSSSNNNNNNNNGQCSKPNAKTVTSSSSPDRVNRQSKAVNDNGKAGNKSSVWYEYGCV